MELKDSFIYGYIKEYLNEISIVKFKKGEYITRSSENLQEIYLILEGTVKVECITQNGKSFLVDELSKNEFVGKISYMHDQSLFCDITATSNATCLKIDKNTFKKLQKNPEFLNIFFIKTSRRIYYMYKKLMMKDLFRLEELLAYHILENADEKIFKFKSMYSLCKNLSISRKSLYNTLNKLISKNCIAKKENTILILNEGYLYELSTFVRQFNARNDNDLKFNVQ